MQLQIREHVNPRTWNWQKISETSVLVLLSLSILWRGGKSLEMTWLLVGVVGVVTIISFFSDRKISKIEILNPKPEIPVVLWGSVMLFVLFTFLSYIFSTTQNYGLDEVLRSGAYALLIFWMMRKAQEDENGKYYIRRIIRVIAVTVLAACMIGILVYIFQPVNRFVGTFFDYRFHTDYWPNAWAELLLLAWPVVVYWSLRDFKVDYQTARGRIELLVRSAILGLVFGTFFLAYSRGALLVLVAQLLLWVGCIYRKTKPDFPWKPAMPIVVMVAAVACIVFLSGNTLRSQYYEVQEIKEKVTFTASEGTSSVSERGQFWMQSAILAAQRPVFGWGPYSFRFVQPRFQSEVLATSDHPHNVMLKIAAERGIPAALLYAVVLGLLLYTTCRMLLSKDVEVGTLRFSYRMLLTIGIVGLLAHNMIDYNLQFVGIALPFWILVSILFSFVDFSASRRMDKKITRPTECALAIILLLVAFYEGTFLVVSSVGRHAEARGEAAVALAWYDRSATALFTRDLHLSRAKILFADSRYDSAEQAVQTYFTSNEQDARGWKREGDIALLQGDKEQALTSYSHAYEIGRYNDVGILHGLLEAYLASDRMDVIERRKDEFDSLLAEFADAVAQNTHYIALSPNVEEFIAVANQIAKIVPDDAPRYQVMAAKVDHHAQVERERIEARPPGFLW